MALENRPCRIFFCYRRNTAQIANFVSSVMIRDTENDYGNIWYSNRIKEGNFDEDPEALMRETEIVVFFIGEHFTGGFLDEHHQTIESTVTARELVAMEKERRRREENHEKELRILMLNIDGGYLDQKCYDDLRILFLNAGLMAPNPRLYTSRNPIVFDSRNQDVFDLVKNDLAPRCAKPPEGRPIMLDNGNYIFGSYSQITEDGTDDTPIEWIELTRRGNQVLLLSRYVLDCQRFDRSSNNSWNGSYIKKWLNGRFRKLAFSNREAEYVLPSTDESIGGCVFLLSKKDVEALIPSEESRLGTATVYARGQGLWFNEIVQSGEKAGCLWWLRTSGTDPNTANCVISNGTIPDEGVSTYADWVGVRPALWVKLDG